MHLALLALALCATSQSETLTLSADTYLDRKAPGANSGREPLLLGGIDRAILVRFPELGLRIGAGKKVRSASLVLSVARSGDPQFASVGRVLKPWHEADARRDLSGGASPMVAVGSATWTSAIAGTDGLDWERDGAAGGNDCRLVAGASATLTDELLTISGLEAAVQAMVDVPQQNYGFRIAFSNSTSFFSADSLGLGPRLKVEFDDAPAAAMVDLQVLLCEPVVPVKHTDGQTVQWRLTVRNAGVSVSAARTLRATYRGLEETSVKDSTPLLPGASKEMLFESPWHTSGAHLRPLVVRVESPERDRNPSDNGLTLYLGALSVALPGADLAAAQAVVTDLNERVFPFSKFGAWPSGCIERLQLVQDPAAADVVARSDGEDLTRALLLAVSGLPQALLRPHAGDPPVVDGAPAAGFVSEMGQVGILPDTRDDQVIPRDLAIPGRATTVLIGEVPMNEGKFLSRSETTIINSQIGRPRSLPWEATPSSIFFHVFSPGGRPPPEARLDVFQLVGGAFGAQPVFSAALEADGSALMPSREAGAFGRANPYGELNKDGSNAWLLAVVSVGGSRTSTWIPVWQLWDEFARGNQAAGFIELRVQLPTAPLDLAQNLALGKFVTDLSGRVPVALNALVDGKGETSLDLSELPDGYWIEVDLGRDRQIGQISLAFNGPVWKQFRILTYKTAQGPEEAVLWAEESDGPSNAQATKTEDGGTVLNYASRSVRSRFVRIVPLSSEEVKLTEIKVVPIRSG